MQSSRTQWPGEGVRCRLPHGLAHLVERRGDHMQQGAAPDQHAGALQVGRHGLASTGQREVQMPFPAGVFRGQQHRTVDQFAHLVTRDLVSDIGHLGSAP